MISVVAGCSSGSGGRNADSANPNPNPSQPVASAISAVSDPACGAPQPAVLTGTGVGLLRIGARVEEIKAKCMVLLDTTLAQGVEGQPERRLTVVVAGISTPATVVDDRIWRIEITSPAFRTQDTLGVGVRVQALRTPDARLAHGEGSYVLRKDHCGLSFRLSSATGAFSDLASVPDTTRVRSVLVTGC